MAVTNLFRKLRPHGLRSQLILGITSILAILMSLLVIELMDRQKNFLLKLNHDRAFALSTNLASTANSYVISYELAGLQKLVSTYKNNPGLQYAIVTSDDGIVLAHTDEKYLGLKAMDSVSAKLRSVNSTQTLIENNSILDIAAPIINHDKIVGWARIGLSQEYIASNLKAIRKDGFLFILISLILGSIFAILIAGRLSKGLHKLISVAKKIKSGNRDVRAEPAKSLEVTELGIAINQMLDGLILSESALRDSFESSAIGIAIVSMEGKFIKVNPELCRMLGYTEQELLSLTFKDISYPESLDSDNLFIENVRKNKADRYKTEKRYYHKNGAIVWVNLNSSVVKDNSGAPLYFISQMEDITEKKKVAGQFKESELQFKNLVEKSLVGVYIIQNGKYVYVNPKFAQILGYTQEEMLNIEDHRKIVVDEDYKPAALVAWRKKADAGIIDDFHIELKYKRKDGTVIWAEAYCGETIYKGAKAILGSLQDITERKNSEAKILERESQLSAFFENIEGAAALLNVEKKYVLFNKRFIEDHRFLSGHDPYLGEEVYDFLPDELKQQRLSTLDNVLRGNKQVVEADHVRNGSRTYYRSSFIPVITDGKVTGISTYSLDLTKSKEAEMKVRESEEKFRLSFMTSQDTFYIGTLNEGRIIDVNNSFYDLFGYSREEAIGKTSAELNLYIYSEEREKMVAGLKSNKSLKDLELTCRKKSGELMLVSVTVNVWTMNNEQVIMAVIRDITERKKAENDLQKINHDIGERVKELNCLYKMSELSNDPDKSMQDILQDCVNVIPPSYQYPEITCARIKFEEQTFVSADFIESRWKQEQNIISKGVIIGNVEVYYEKNMPEEAEGPFLAEERLLINSIADILGSSAERKKATELFRHQFEHSPDIIVFVNKDHTIESINKGQPGGLSAKELIGMTHYDMLPEEARDLSKKDLIKCFETGQIQEHEIKIKYDRWMSSRYVPIIIDDEIAYVMVIGTNITARKKAENELKDSEEKFRSLVEDTSVGVFILQDEKIIYANPGFENICGYSKDELLDGMNFQQLIYEDDAEWVKDNYELRISGKKPSDEYMLRAMRKDGELIYVDVIVSRIVYDNNPAVIGSVIDKTRHVEEEKLIGRAVTDAQEKERTQIGMELHDNVKQIMAASLMSLDYIKNNIDNKDECISIITNVKGYILEAINELRRLSHQLTPSVDDDTGTLVEKIEKLINDSKISDKIEMLLDIDELNTPVNAEIQLAFYRIMQEQFNNILKYSKASTVLIRIKKKNGFLNMTIIDNGIGFDTTVRKAGIGLENIRRRVNILNGNVKVVSSPGEGCQVNVSVPSG